MSAWLQSHARWRSRWPGILFFFLILAPIPDSMATRYDWTTLDVGKVIAINNENRYAGLAPSGKATVWYHDTGSIISLILDDTGIHSNGDVSNIAVTGISNNTNPVGVLGDEIVVGYYNDASAGGLRKPVYWKRDALTNYKSYYRTFAGSGSAVTENMLTPYKRSILPCEAAPFDPMLFKPYGSECYHQDPFSPNAPDPSAQCAVENAGWLHGDPLVVACDDEAYALDISSGKIIIGVSVYTDTITSNRVKRPVYWINQVDGSGNLSFVAHDLGVPKVRSIVYGSYFDSGLGFNRYQYSGEPVSISEDGKTIGGYLDFNGDGTLTPYVWFNPGINEHVGPKYFTLDSSQTVSFANMSRAGGWYEPADAPGTRVARFFNLSVVAGNFGDLLVTGASPVEVSGLGGADSKIFDSNGFDFVGTGQNSDSTFSASYYSDRCGQEDLNSLLATPLTGVTLTEAYQLKGTALNARILAHDDTLPVYGQSYLLTPVDKILDLKVSLRSEQGVLYVNDRNTYYADVTNLNVDTGNNDYATCVVVNLQDFVYFPEDHERSMKQEPGGVTYLDASVDNGICTISPLAVSCRINRINPGETKTITIQASPREILTERTVRTLATVSAREERTDFNVPLSGPDLNNKAEIFTTVKRDACFIATAAYGSLWHDEVVILRQFRDNYLLTSSMGRWLVSTYYQVSPPLAEIISDSEIYKWLVRAFLTPFVLLIKYPLLILLLIVAGLFWVLRLFTSSSSTHQTSQQASRREAHE